MTLDLQLVNGIGRKTAERMIEHGIDSITKLATSNVKDLSKINGIGNSTAKKYIHMAQHYLDNMKDRENEKNFTLKHNNPISINSGDEIDVPKLSILEELLNNPILSDLEEDLDDSQLFFSGESSDFPKSSDESVEIVQGNEIEKNRSKEENTSKSTKVEAFSEVPTPSEENFEIAQEYLESMKGKEKEQHIARTEKNSIHLSLKEFLDTPKTSISEEPLDIPKPTNEKYPSPVPIKSYTSLKEEKIAVTQKEISELGKSKNKSREKKLFGKRKKNLPTMEKKASYQKTSKITPQKTKSQEQVKRKGKKQYLKASTPQVSKKPKSSETASKIEEKEISIDYSKAFFEVETVQRIRFLHFKIKQIEKGVFRGEVDNSIKDIELFHEYITLLNLNYKTKNQNLILRELDLTLSYYDPADKVDINIYDIMFECARALWVMALFCANLSEKYESEGNWENAVVTMVECSKSYKASSYFSGAAVNQKYIGSSLDPEYLEFKSEETRILAQSIAALREEENNNFFLASKLYSGLSALSKRIYYLKPHDKKTKMKIKAQFNYDLGKSCHLKARAIMGSLSSQETNKKISEKMNQQLLKANYYYSTAEGLWENLIENVKDLSKEEKNDIERNLTVVNENIMENDVEILNYENVKHIQDPNPIIIVPENLSEHIPKVVLYLRRYNYRDHGVKRLKRFRSIKFEEKIVLNKKSELLNRKAALGRLINELQYLYDNNDIDIDKYMELLEKYTIKINDINSAVEELNNS